MDRGPTGRASSEDGPPRVRATRLDAPGREAATVGDYVDAGSGEGSGEGGSGEAGWPTRLALGGPGCWLVTGELDGDVVRMVVRTD